MEIGHIPFEKRERALGKNNTKAECGIRRILFKDLNVPRREAPLDQQRKQQTSRAGTDDVNLHRTD